MIKKFKLFKNIDKERLKILLSHFNSFFDKLGYNSDTDIINGYFQFNQWSSEYRKNGDYMFELIISYELNEINLIKNFYINDDVQFIDIFLKTLNGLTMIDTNKYKTTFNITDVDKVISEVTLDNFLFQKETNKYNL